jgi:hypothetical protein
MTRPFALTSLRSTAVARSRSLRSAVLSSHGRFIHGGSKFPDPTIVRRMIGTVERLPIASSDDLTLPERHIFR